MKVAISSLPQSPWWGQGIISYEDNPFMKNGVIPNQALLTKERDNLINTLKKNKIEVIEFPFPEKLEETKYGYDYVYIRDGFISDLNGKALILNFSQKKRQQETKLIADQLEKLNYELEELSIKDNVFAEGGEFYFCPKDKILFSGINRNTIKGAEEVASFLNVNQLIMIETSSFHLDTVLTTVFDKYGNLKAIVFCDELISKKSTKNLKKLSKEFNVDLISIGQEDSIGSKNKLGSLAVNSFSSPGLLISSVKYSSSFARKKLSELQITLEECPVSQYQLSGGSVHCITNEL
ncbi:arginine deiminase-related protein [Candidatus Marinimicrobia bacterium]|nr:arginine deiminase-related protein [Candidatus Neomarinimicrobiota bacterium]